MNKQFKWTEDWRLMLHQKALAATLRVGDAKSSTLGEAAGKVLSKTPRVIPMRHLDTCKCPICKEKNNNDLASSHLSSSEGIALGTSDPTSRGTSLSH